MLQAFTLLVRNLRWNLRKQGQDEEVEESAEDEEELADDDGLDGDGDSDSKRSKSFNAQQVLAKRRVITIFGEIDEDVAQKVTEKMLAMSYENDADPITIYISSPGGHVESGDSIFDVIQFIKPPVQIVGTGWVGSIATHIYLAAEKENRYCLPSTRFLIHQPSTGFTGDASDIEINAREILKTRERINQVIADRTGQDLERIEKDTDRDYWMSAEESQEYGLVGKIIEQIDELPLTAPE